MPTGRSGKRYSPCWLAGAVPVNPVARLSSRTLEPTIAAPDASVTIPEMLPRNVCAESDAAKRTRIIERIICMEILLWLMRLDSVHDLVKLEGKARARYVVWTIL